MDAVTPLGRLLSDPTARASFLSDREAWLDAQSVSEEQRPTLTPIDEQALEIQARLLIDKRRREAAAFLPATLDRLGHRRYAATFTDYAPSHWPRGHLRHAEDALAFLRHLEASAPGSASSADWAYVSSWIAWRQGRRLSWSISHHADGGPFSTLAFVLRRPERSWRLVIPLPFPAALGRALRSASVRRACSIAGNRDLPG